MAYNANDTGKIHDIHAGRSKSDWIVYYNLLWSELVRVGLES